MTHTSDHLAEYNDRVTRSLTVYRQRERAKARASRPSRPSMWQRFYFFLDSHTHTPTPQRQIIA